MGTPTGALTLFPLSNQTTALRAALIARLKNTQCDFLLTL